MRTRLSRGFADQFCPDGLLCQLEPGAALPRPVAKDLRQPLGGHGEGNDGVVAQVPLHSSLQLTLQATEAVTLCSPISPLVSPASLQAWQNTESHVSQ